MTTKRKPPIEETEETPTSEEKNSDIESLLPASEVFELSSGAEVRVNRLKTRETLKLLKVLTVGGGGMLTSIDWSGMQDNAEAFAGKLVALVIYAVPLAEDQALEFIQAMVSPKDLIDRPRSKADREFNKELWEELAYELDNPEIEDTINIIIRIVQREAKDIQGLGKRLRLLMPAALNL